MHRLIIISDLHLGGRPDTRDEDGQLIETGSQLCHAYRELVAFVDHLTARDDAEERLELVINGDLVDFLAPDPAEDGSRDVTFWDADQERVKAKLDAVEVRTAEVNGGRGFFAALADFLRRDPRHRLTILLGNHDVELALPAVRRHLSGLLGGSERLKFIYDGEAYVVGPVLIEHGNRYDLWNVVDYSRLRQERAVLSRRLPVDEEEREERFFVPPPGTLLVTQVMNLIKARFRFVDLLKPETEAVIPILLALCRELRVDLQMILDATSIARARSRKTMASAVMPGAPGELADAPKAAAVPTSSGGVSSGSELDEVLKRVLGEDAGPFLGGGGHELSFASDTRAAWERLKGRVKVLKKKLSKARLDRRLLLLALRALNANDVSFDPDREVASYLDAARHTAHLGDFELIVYGHTHLPKRIDISSPDGVPSPDATRPRWYYNTGTWCSVMSLPPELLGDDMNAAERALDGFITAIDANRFEPYTARFFPYLEVVLDGDALLEHQLLSFREGDPRADLIEHLNDNLTAGGVS